LTTTQVITFLKDKFAQDWSRTSILDLLNTVQHIMCDHDCEQMTYTCDNSNFPVPFLKTTAGIIEYEIIDANLSSNITISNYATSCRRVSNLFIKSNGDYTQNYNQNYRREPFAYGNVNPSYMNNTGITFERWPARFIDARGVQPAKVIFLEDPGLTTDKFYVEFFTNPIELSSESIPMSFNVTEFFDVILDGVVGLVEQAEHGESKRWDKFMTTGCKKFWSNINKGNENRLLRIQRKEC